MKNHLLLAGLLSLLPAPAHAALSQEYYTWGGFDAVVSAFQRTALIFGGASYQSLFSTLAIASLAALIMRTTLGLMFGGFKGEGNVVTQAVVPWLLSTAIFIGTVLPTGTLYIYDQVENKNQAVGGIPDIIVFVAAATNLIERTLVDQVTTAGDPVGYGNQAGGKGFFGLYTLSKAPLQATDSLLDPSLNKYVDDCVLIEASQRSGYVKEFRKDTTDLVATLGEAVNPSNFTVMYDEALSPGGVAMSCTDAWANLQPRLTAADVLTNNLKIACTEMGFNAETATELQDCQAKMDGVVGSQLVPGKTSMDFLRNAYVAQALDATLSGDSSGTAFGNFSILNKASGTMSTVNNWLPTIRAVVLAVTVALLPFLSLLMLTPFMGRVAKFILGSFVFLTIWGVTDAVLHQFIIDYSNKLYSDIRQYNMGLDALRFFPSSTEKVLAMFGLVRASGLALAGVITTSVMGLGGSVASAIGERVTGDVTATGTQAEQQMLDPGAKAMVRRHNGMAIPTETLANSFSWEQRQTAEYSQLAGGVQQQLGSVDGAGGMGNYLSMRHGQGVTSSYRGQGDVALNKAFMQQAEAMGIPREKAQQIAAATVNHGEGLAELRRLQAQGYTGEEAADTYWKGKTVDHMQGRSVGQEDGFTMYRPTAGQETGKWGSISTTWQDGQLVALQGNTVNVASTEQLRANYDKAYSSAITESYRADKALGETITKSWGNSGTWSQVNAAAQQLYSATSGSIDASKAISTSVVSSLRNSQTIDERTGQSIDKSAWAQITAGAGTPQVSPIKAGIEGGASWRVTTSDGKSYLVHQSAEEARSTNETLGKTWRNVVSDTKSSNYSRTAQAALAQMESVTGTKAATETASVAYQRADEFRENQGQAHAKAVDVSASLARDFYHYVGEKQFGGGATGDRSAIKHVEELAAEGKLSEISALKEQYLADRDINLETLGAQLPAVKGPDISKAPDPEATHALLEAGKENLKEELQAQPRIKRADLTAKVSRALKSDPHAVDEKEIERGIEESRHRIETGKAEIESKGSEKKSSSRTSDEQAVPAHPEIPSSSTEALTRDVVPATGSSPAMRPAERPEAAIPPIPAEMTPPQNRAGKPSTTSQNDAIIRELIAKDESAPGNAHNEHQPSPDERRPHANAMPGDNTPRLPKGGV